MKPNTRFSTLDQLIAFAREQRHSAAIVAVPAALFVELVLAAAKLAAKLKDLPEDSEQFLRGQCNAVDRIPESDGRVVMPHAATLYKLAQFLPTPLLDDETAEVPTAKPTQPAGIPVAKLADLGIDGRVVNLLTSEGWATVEAIPRDQAALVKVKGIGASTAAAILDALDMVEY